MRRMVHIAMLILISASLVFQSGAGSEAGTLEGIPKAVRDMCLHPDRRGEYIEVTGEAEAGVLVRIAGAKIDGEIKREDWDGINQRIDRYKTDPRICALEILPVLLESLNVRKPAFSACNATELRREVQFRLKQVEMAVSGNFLIEGPHASESCARARTVFVVASLGGIAWRPPPAGTETVWIGSSGYGYGHTPFRSGVRSDEYSRFSLPELVTDYLACTANRQRDAEGRLQEQVNRFEETVISRVDEVQECDMQWTIMAKTSWTSVMETANRLVEVAR